MKINYFVHTEIGDRPCNEDRYAVSKCPAGLCFALADGLGGLDRGEVAAELACNAVAEYAQAQAVFSNAAVEQAFLRAQQAVLARQKAEHNETQMKTTLNIVMLDKQNMYWGHVCQESHSLQIVQSHGLHIEPNPAWGHCPGDSTF